MYSKYIIKNHMDLPLENTWNIFFKHFMYAYKAYYTDV